MSVVSLTPLLMGESHWRDNKACLSLIVTGVFPSFVGAMAL